MIDISNLTKDIVDSSLKNLFALDQYKELGGALGGWYPVSATVWGTVSAFAMAGWDTIEMILRGAFSVAAALAGLLADFVADLTDVLAIIAAGSAPFVNGAVRGATIAARLLVMVSSPLLATGGEVLESVRPGRSGGNGRGGNAREWAIFGGVVVGIAAIVVVAVTFGGLPAAAVAVSVIAAGAVIGGTIAVSNNQTGSGGRTAMQPAFSRTSRALGLSGGRG